MMPLFSIVGGTGRFRLVAAAVRQTGRAAQPCLWVFCPNILAHCRLITSDVGSTALGVAATYRVLAVPATGRPGAGRCAAGVMLGLAQLTKFSMLLLYAVWPFLWLVRLGLVTPRAERPTPRSRRHGPRRAGRRRPSILTIDAGYFFEGVGIPLERFEFGSATLTRPVARARCRPHSQNPLSIAAWQFRVNRFRGTWLGRLPAPLPEHYCWVSTSRRSRPKAFPGLERAYKAIQRGRRRTGPAEAGSSYRERRRLSGLSQRRAAANGLVVLLLLHALLQGARRDVAPGHALAVVARDRAPRRAGRGPMRSVLWTVPVVILFFDELSHRHQPGLALRPVDPPYVFIATGKLVPWV